MTVILPDNYHAKAALERGGVSCMSREEALHQDIRPLRIGILNIMPQAESYEFNLLFPLGRSILQIIPVWIRLHSHDYHSTDQEHLDALYVSFEEAVETDILDGLILTGAPVEEIEFEEVTYWDEITSILDYARGSIASTMGLCWGGLALANYLGIRKTMYPIKLFGVYETRNLVPEHPITGAIDDVFWCPQSRFAGIPDAVLEKEAESSKIRLLAYADEGGYSIFETPDHRFVMHLGHPEYNSGRLVAEARRDQAKGREDVRSPENFDMDRPLNRWRSHRNEFFGGWIKYIYSTTKY